MSKSPSESSIYFMIGIFAILGVALVGIGIIPIEVAPDMTATVGGTVTPYKTVDNELYFKYDDLVKCPIGVACVASTNKNFAIVRTSVDANGNTYVSSGKVLRNSIISPRFKPSSVTLSPKDELKVNLALNMMYVVSAPAQIAAPAGVVAKALDNTRVSVTWNPVYGAVSYKIERSGGLSVPSMPYSVVGTSIATSFSNVVESGTAYKYRVIAVGKDGTNSLPSSEATVTTPYPAPMISSISPPSGPSGTELVINGKYFMEGGSVVVCGIEAMVKQVTATVIKAIVPACKVPGLVDVVVKSSDGQKATLAKWFTYTKPMNEVESAAKILAKHAGFTEGTEDYNRYVYLLSNNWQKVIYDNGMSSADNVVSSFAKGISGFWSPPHDMIVPGYKYVTEAELPKKMLFFSWFLALSMDDAMYLTRTVGVERDGNNIVIKGRMCPTPKAVELCDKENEDAPKIIASIPDVGQFIDDKCVKKLDEIFHTIGHKIVAGPYSLDMLNSKTELWSMKKKNALFDALIDLQKILKECKFKYNGKDTDMESWLEERISHDTVKEFIILNRLALVMHFIKLNYVEEISEEDEKKNTDMLVGEIKKEVARKLDMAYDIRKSEGR